MFSEYASRFLAQSQARLPPSDPAASSTDHNHTNPHERRRQQSDWSSRSAARPGNRTYLSRIYGGGRRCGGNGYPSGGESPFGNLASFGYRTGYQDAPLFQASLNRDSGDGDDRERENEDLAALQHSRRVFATNRLGDDLEESLEEGDNDDSRASLDQGSGHDNALYGRPGLRSSWVGDRKKERKGARTTTTQNARRRSRSRESDGDGRAKMVDIGLDSTVLEREEDREEDSHGSKTAYTIPLSPRPLADSVEPVGIATRRNAADSEMGLSTSSVAESTAPQAVETWMDGQIFTHDSFFAWIFLIALASLLSSFVLIYLHTSTPSAKKPWGDTVYTALRASFHLLAVDTLVSIIVSLVWLAALQSFVRPLVTCIVFAVPVILIIFSLYPFTASYQGRQHGSSVQDWVMRWLSLIPAAAAVVWVALVIRGRQALRTAIEILEFSCCILGANPALVLVGMGCLATIALWSWIWLAMFARVFLGGYFSTGLSRFIIWASSWWLGVYFAVMYIWTLSMILGVQRGTTAATVSQWYFHRNRQPAAPSRDVVAAALNHSLTTMLGSISLSTLLALGMRMPLLVLPRRVANGLGLVACSLVPSSLSAITNPLSLTYAAIHSQPLAVSARGLSQMDLASDKTTLDPRTFRSAPLLPYRLAKLILHATRFVMSMGLGFGGWVMTARQLQITMPDGVGVRGSAYAYVVGLAAACIGWGILGAMEGILSAIVDAVIICYGSERRMANGGGGYCMEAAYLFGDRGRERY